jgi:hypothetical protein
MTTLSAALALIADPARWTTGASARDDEGKSLPDGAHPAAVCWDYLGAIEHVMGPGHWDRAYAVLDALDLDDDYLDSLSDHAQVLAALAEAAA